MKSRWNANLAGQGFAEVVADGGMLTSVKILDAEINGAEYLAPHFVDIQLNGYAGVDFSAADLEPEQVVSITSTLRRSGTGHVCPTLITNSREAILRNLKVLEEARRADEGFALAAPCYHLEGPYFKPSAARGVHSVCNMRPADWAEFCLFQHAAGGNIGIVTLDPSAEGAAEFTERAAKSGVVVAIGHTEASAAEIHAVVEAGARLSTHLGNGCGPMMHRHDNSIWPQLARDELMASIICDGFHLPADVVRAFLRAKRLERLILITDATHVAGLAPGRYRLVDTDIELLSNGKVIRGDGGSLAGSALTMDRAVSEFVRLGEVPLGEAIRAATANPCRLLGRAAICGELQPGAPANMIRFQFTDGAVKVTDMYVRGVPVEEVRA